MILAAVCHDTDMPYLFIVQVELERQSIHHHDNQGFLATENQELNNKIEELKSDIVSPL